MKKSLIVLLTMLAVPHGIYAEALYGLELAPSSMREKHLDHFMNLFRDQCFGQESQDAATQKVVNGRRFRPAKDFEGVYEEYFEGLSYAVSPNSDVCTVDVLLEYQSGKLLLSLEAVQKAIKKNTSYRLVNTLDKVEEGPNSESVQTIESHFKRDVKSTNAVVLTYPTSNQDVFYMTLSYHYE
ncbi:MAG TPA: hypothetical protein DCF62_02695 [Porticoccaceae bacterium]|nr:hypothetical protein [Porticoccaceae bacterium]